MRAVGKLMLIACAGCALLAYGVGVAAQNGPQLPREPADVLIAAPQQVGFALSLAQEGRVPAPPPPEGAPPVPAPPDTLVFFAAEMMSGGRVVRGAPYSAQETHETTQVLLDGNRIVRRTTATVYRDSEGRTRREQTLGAVGPFAIAGEAPVTYFINDPVAGAHYILDPRARTARRAGPPPSGAIQVAPMPAHPAAPPPPGAPPAEATITFERRVGSPPAGAAPQIRERAPGPGVTPANVATESLGTQMIEGVEAEGRRHTLTIPAGEIGNEAPIQIVTEQWYSAALQTMLMSRHHDPRFGETVFRLTNISREEPARALFEVPADYTMIEAPTGPPRQMRRPRQ